MFIPIRNVNITRKIIPEIFTKDIVFILFDIKDTEIAVTNTAIIR